MPCAHARLIGTSVAALWDRPFDPEGLSRVYAPGADECLMDADRLDEGMSNLTGQHIITFHAIELALSKSFLIEREAAHHLLRLR